MSSDPDSITSTQTDGFGLIPVSFSPGPVRRFLGHSVFVVEADRIVVASAGIQQEILFSEIESVEAQGRKVLIACRGNRSHQLVCGSCPTRLAGLVSRLKAEADAYNGIMRTSGPLELAAGLAMFENAITFRAQPYVRAAEILLKTAADNYFSDIHLEPVNSGMVKITFRQGGKVHQASQLSRLHHERLLARLKYLAGCLSHVDDAAQEGAFKQQDFDVRLSTFPTDNGERASLRIITALRYPDIAALGWKSAEADLWLNQIRGDRGLFIISGPVGSGKTTAMYATLSQLAQSEQRLRVVTIEDPVEAAIPGICQSSLDAMKEKDLAAAFKHLLRQDPDVVALGEIRDSACIKEALQAGLSGHLILATFHAGSIAETIDRIRQMGIEDALVMSGLKGILHLNLHRQGQKVTSEVHFGTYDGQNLRQII